MKKEIIKAPEINLPPMTKAKPSRAEVLSSWSLRTAISLAKAINFDILTLLPEYKIVRHEQ